MSYNLPQCFFRHFFFFFLFEVQEVEDTGVKIKGRYIADIVVAERIEEGIIMAERAKRLGLLDLSLDGMDDTGRGVSCTTSPKNGCDGGSMKHTGSLKILRHNASFKNLEFGPSAGLSQKQVEEGRAGIQALTMKKQRSGGSLRNLFGSRGKASAECSAVSRGSVARSTSGRDLQGQSLKSVRRMSASNLEEIRPEFSTELIRQASYSVTSKFPAHTVSLFLRHRA
jgi:hypothetical protein